MKASAFIQAVRDEFNDLYKLHQQAVSTNGKLGCYCLNIDRLMEKINQSDEDILIYFLAQGAQIEDADLYLSGHSNE